LLLGLLVNIGAVELRAQTATCTAKSKPRSIRPTGTAELVGDIDLTCTGGVLGRRRGISISVLLNTSITARTFFEGTQSEAKLTIYDSNGDGSHVVYASPGGNTLTWSNVNVAEPGSYGPLQMRITGVRTDATRVHAGSGSTPVVRAFVSMTEFTLNNPQVTVALLTPDMSFQVRDCTGEKKLQAGGAAVGCSGSNNSGVNNLITGTRGRMQFSVAFQQEHATFTERGYELTTLGNQRTRLHARFTNVPAGARLFVTNDSSRGSTAGSDAVLVQVDGTYVPEQPLPRYPEGLGLRATHNLFCQALTPIGDYRGVEVPVNNGSAEAVWEVTSSGPNYGGEVFVFGVAVAHTGIPTFAEVHVEGFLGPLFSESTPAIPYPPTPRFKPVNQPQKLAAFNAAAVSPKVLPVGRTTLVTITAGDDACISPVTSIGLPSGLIAGPVAAVNSTTWKVPITVPADFAQGDAPAVVVSPVGTTNVTLTVGPPVFSISGRVTRKGAGLSGVTIGLGGSLASATDAEGHYSFTGLPAGTYIVHAVLYNHSFEPPRITITNLQADTTVNFNAHALTLVGPTAPWSPSPSHGWVTPIPNLTLAWQGDELAQYYDVYFGTTNNPPWLATVPVTSFEVPALASGSTYYWRVVAKNQAGHASSPTWSFQALPASAGLGFHILSPCRVLDTRGLGGPGTIGGPALAAGATRAIAVSSSACQAPIGTQAYSLNMTAVPAG
jgi:hypothetical protein